VEYRAVNPIAAGIDQSRSTNAVTVCYERALEGDRMGSQLEADIAAALAAIANTAASPQARLASCDLLIRNGVVECALPTLRSLAAVPMCAGRARLLLRTGEYLLRRGLLNDLVPVGIEGSSASQPRIPGVAATAFWRDKDPQRASQNLLIVFTGFGKEFWISLDLLHRILRHSFGQILYLRDFLNLCYQAGVPGLGNNYAVTLDRLKHIVHESSVEKLYMLGSSAGGYAALRYGLDLSADAILALSPITELCSDGVTARRLKARQVSPEEMDLLPDYERAHRRPNATIVYGAQNPKDSAAAKRFADFPEFRLVAVPDFAEHTVTAHLIGTGEFEQFVQDLVKK
jgi:hypothetical protein